MFLSSRFLIAILGWLALTGVAPHGAPAPQLMPQRIPPGAQITPQIRSLGEQVTVDIEPPTSPPPASSRRITLDVVVTNRSGKPVTDLQQQDFTVLDDKKPQAILHFRSAGGTGAAGGPAARVLVAIDAVNNSWQDVGFERGQVEKFLRQGSGELPLPMSVTLVADKDQRQSPFTRDRNALAEFLNAQRSGFRVHSRAQGIYGAAERTGRSLRALEKLEAAQTPSPGRMLLIWLGEGWPYLEGPNVELSPKARRALFRHVVWQSTAGREARITLYNVNALATERLSRAFYYEHFLKPVDSADKIQGGNAALQVFAVQSGGRVLNRSNDIADSMSACLDDAGVSYTLAFDAPPASHANDYHRIQVKIDKPNLAARTRTGYYAQP